MTDDPRSRKVAEHAVPQSVIDAFEGRYSSYLSMERDDHEWRNTWRYKHEHIQSMWEGWRDGWIALASRPSAIVEEPMAAWPKGAADSDLSASLTTELTHIETSISPEVYNVIAGYIGTIRAVAGTLTLRHKFAAAGFLETPPSPQPHTGRAGVTEGARETAWLIERPSWRDQDRRPRWWRSLVRGKPATIYVVDASNDNEWTYDANEAIRFSRQIDAEDFIKALDLPPSLMKATEHVWVGAALNAALTVEPEAGEVK